MFIGWGKCCPEATNAFKMNSIFLKKIQLMYISKAQFKFRYPKTLIKMHTTKTFMRDQ